MNLNEALKRIGKNIISDARSILKKQGHIATSSLYNTMAAKVEGEQLTFKLEPYGRYVDQGRKKGKYAPPQAIKDWCKIKGIDQSLAFVINRKIFEKGIKPSLFFTTAYEENIKNIDKYLDMYMDDMIDELLE